MTLEDRGGETVPLDLAGVLLAAGMGHMTITLPETDALPPSMSGATGVMFMFELPGVPMLRVFVRRDAFPPGAGAELHEMFDQLHTIDDAAVAAEIREANLLAGLLPDSPIIHCPGCGSRLFGEVARRGACLACYPDLPAGDAAQVAP